MQYLKPIALFFVLIWVQVTPSFAGMTQKNHFLEIGTQLHYFDYQEDFTPPQKSEERGFLPGLHLAYQYKDQSERFRFIWELNYTSTKITYDGSLQNVLTGAHLGSLLDQSGIDLTENLIQLGYSFLKDSSHELSALIGFEKRNWNRSIGIHIPIYALKENYMSLFLPVGLKYNYSLTDRLSIGLDVTLRIPIGSTFQVIKTTFPILIAENTLITQPSWKIQAPLQYWFNSSIGITLTPSLQTIH